MAVKQKWARKYESRQRKDTKPDERKKMATERIINENLVPSNDED